MMTEEDRGGLEPDVQGTILFLLSSLRHSVNQQKLSSSSQKSGGEGGVLDHVRQYAIFIAVRL